MRFLAAVLLALSACITLTPTDSLAEQRTFTPSYAPPNGWGTTSPGTYYVVVSSCSFFTTTNNVVVVWGPWVGTGSTSSQNFNIPLQKTKADNVPFTVTVNGDCIEMRASRYQGGTYQCPTHCYPIVNLTWRAR